MATMHTGEWLEKHTQSESLAQLLPLGEAGGGTGE
jgi:hypothetical protein